MEVKINREIRNYTEAMFFGLSLRQFIFSACACVVAVGIYFLLKPYRGCAFWAPHPLRLLVLLNITE